MDYYCIIVRDKVVSSSYMDIVDSPDRIRFNGRRARPAHCFLFVLFPPDRICSHIFLHFLICDVFGFTLQVVQYVFVFPPPSFSLAFPICIVSPEQRVLIPFCFPNRKVSLDRVYFNHIASSLSLSFSVLTPA